MRVLRVIFVVLIAVGVCAALYGVLIVALAAYVRYQSSSPPDPSVPATAPHEATK